MVYIEYRIKIKKILVKWVKQDVQCSLSLLVLIHPQMPLPLNYKWEVEVSVLNVKEAYNCIYKLNKNIESW